MVPMIQALLGINSGLSGLPHCSSVDDVHAGYFFPKGTTVIANIWRASINGLSDSHVLIQPAGKCFETLDITVVLSSLIREDSSRKTAEVPKPIHGR